MKNIMRRTVAFMLMACLLLSVMAPMGLFKAEATTTSGDVITYYVDGSAHFSGSATYLRIRDQVARTCGDFTYLGKGSTNGHTDLYATQFKISGFNDADLTDNVVSEWIALKFDVAEAGVYYFKADKSGATANIFVEAYDANKTYTDAYIGSVATHGVNAELIAYYFNQGSYVLLYSAASDSGTASYFNGITLTKAKTPETVSMVNGVYSYSTVYSGITCNTTNGYITTVNQKMGDFAFYGHSQYMLQTFKNDSDEIDGSGTTFTAQGSRFAAGEWFAMSFNVAAAGKYDVTLSSVSESGKKALDVYIVPVSSTFHIDSAYLDSLEGSEYAYSAAAAAENTLEGVDLNAEDYLIIFRAKSTGKYALDGLTLRPYTVKGLTTNTMYAKVNAAIAAGEKSVQLTTDITEDVVVTDDATLDLNGKKVTGNVVVTDGKLIDSVGTAEITGTVNVPAANEQVVVNANGVNKLVSYTAKQNGYKLVDDTIQFWFDADFAASAYALLAADEGVTINAVLKANDKEVTVDMSEKVAAWLAQDGSADNGLGISVTGFKAGDVITVTPVFTTAAGNSGVFGNAITYTVPQN